MLDDLKKRKQRLGLTNEELAEKSGVPLGTVQKIMSGITKAPRGETLRALEKVLFAYPESIDETPIPLLEESFSRYMVSKKKGEYTLEDYLALPDEARVELIDGVLYDMATPTTIHQHLIIEIAFQIRNQMDSCGEGCLLLASPVDVQLDLDEKTIVQPDILILCDKEKLTKSRIVGAPDFVVEILSPSTYQKDLMIKGKKYQQAGVKEYWIIEPEAKIIIQFDFTGQHPVHFYSFAQQIPILISGGHCRVDFGVISQKMAMFFEED